MMIEQAVGEELLHLRQKSGLSQAAFSSAIETTGQTMRAYEQNKGNKDDRKPSLNYLFRVATATHCRVSDIIKGAESRMGIGLCPYGEIRPVQVFWLYTEPWYRYDFVLLDTEGSSFHSAMLPLQELYTTVNKEQNFPSSCAAIPEDVKEAVVSANKLDWEHARHWRLSECEQVLLIYDHLRKEIEERGIDAACKKREIRLPGWLEAVPMSSEHECQWRERYEKLKSLRYGDATDDCVGVGHHIYTGTPVASPQAYVVSVPCIPFSVLLAERPDGAVWMQAMLPNGSGVGSVLPKCKLTAEKAQSLAQKYGEAFLYDDAWYQREEFFKNRMDLLALTQRAVRNKHDCSACESGDGGL